MAIASESPWVVPSCERRHWPPTKRHAVSIHESRMDGRACSGYVVEGNLSVQIVKSVVGIHEQNSFRLLITENCTHRMYSGLTT